MNWLELVKFLVPIILSRINPHLGQVSNSVVTGITEAEGMTNASSEEKLAHAVNITNAAVAAINAGTGKALINPEVVNATAGNAISTIVDVVNRIHNASTSVNTKN